MSLFADRSDDLLLDDVIVPMKEVGAYEALWNDRKTSFKSLSERFASNPGSRPSDFVDPEVIESFKIKVTEMIKSNQLDYRTSILINGTYDFPSKLKDAKEPVEVLYYSGNLDYLSTRSVAIVGTRKPSEEGKKRADKLVKMLVKDDVTIVSGLAQGIDTQAHTSAINLKARTIAVIGTPMNTFYPKQNKSLQEYIAKNHLLVSQVPYLSI